LRGIDPPVVGTYDKNPKIPEFNYIPDYRRNKHRITNLGLGVGTNPETNEEDKNQEVP
jgi:hypothetical protein